MGTSKKTDQSETSGGTLIDDCEPIKTFDTRLEE